MDRLRICRRAQSSWSASDLGTVNPPASRVSYGYCRRVVIGGVLRGVLFAATSCIFGGFVCLAANTPAQASVAFAGPPEGPNRILIARCADARVTSVVLLGPVDSGRYPATDTAVMWEITTDTPTGLSSVTIGQVPEHFQEVIPLTTRLENGPHYFAYVTTTGSGDHPSETYTADGEFFLTDLAGDGVQSHLHKTTDADFRANADDGGACQSGERELWGTVAFGVTGLVLFVPAAAVFVRWQRRRRPPPPPRIAAS